MTPGTLHIEALVAGYGAVVAVNGVTCAAAPGRITCVMGRNGVGKTTLLRTIMGQIPVRSGSVRLGDMDLTRLPAHRRAKAGVALVPQGREIFPKLTVRENLLVGLSARTDGRRDLPEDVLALFPILGQFAHRLGGDLSGGQQQQLAIARALVGGPSVLLLDEPTEGIQPNVIQEIGRVLQRLARERGMAIVLVEQYLDFVRSIGDDVLILDRGSVVAQGTCRDLDASTIGRHLSV